MAASDVIANLIINATDRASAVINRIGAAFQNVQTQAQRAEEGSNNLGGAIAFGMIKAQAAIEVAKRGVEALGGAIEKNSQLQLSNMTAAQTFASITGSSYDDASEYIERLNNRLAKSAAALPGATEDYTTLARAIQDKVIPAFQGVDGKISNMKAFEDSVASISESYGVLSASSGVDAGLTGMGLSRALSGGSLGELQRLNLFERNPQILAELRKQLALRNAKDLKDLDVKSRIDLIKQVWDKFVTPEFKLRAATTVDGLIQSFKSMLFDPQTGVFGLSRDLDPVQKGVQSAFSSLNNLLVSLIGDGGLFSQVSGVLSQLGLTVDPMKALRDGLEYVNHYVVIAAKVLEYVRMRLKYTPLEKLLGITNDGDLPDKNQNNQSQQETIAQKIRSTTDFIGEQITGALAWLSHFNFGEHFKGIGAKLADLVNGFFDGLTDSGLLSFGTAGNILSIVANFVGSVFKELDNFIDNLDPNTYNAIAIAAFGAFVTPAIIGIIAEIGASIGLAAGVIPLLLVTAVYFIGRSLYKTITTHWDEISSGFVGFFNDIGRFFKGAFELVWGIVTFNKTLITKGIDDLFQSIADAVNGFRDQIAIAAQSVGINLKTSGQMRGTIASDEANQRIAAAGGKVNADGSVTMKAHYAGNYIPAGFANALASERANMPSGAQPVIANSSEAILTPSQLKGMLAGAGGSPITNNFNITGTADPDETARAVLEKFEKWYSQYQRGALA